MDAAVAKARTSPRARMNCERRVCSTVEREVKGVCVGVIPIGYQTRWVFVNT